MNFLFLEPAEQELDEAAAWYDKKAGLGSALVKEVYAAIERILLFPRAWPTLEPGIRRCRTKRFPYHVIYQQQGETIVVVAVMHMRRRPGYWRDRLIE
ncbi:MAG: type II toxin-antitoxin system RelE/ParE family toxin [Acidobacteriota bacterium]|nr:type II toxin-antitoxin system RelE/ParE family toxin [Acidobacteriota bacterium]